MSARKGTYELLRRIEQVELAFGVKQKEEWIDCIMWSPTNAGAFGFTHLLMLKSSGKVGWKPCSEEEELTILRNDYEKDDHKFHGLGEPIPFSVYLEKSSYLGPEALAERRKEIIERVRGEEESNKS